MSRPGTPAVPAAPAVSAAVARRRARGAQFSSARLRRAARRLTSRLRPLPDFLIIGAQKSGTTTLFDYLDQHPDVRAPTDKEVHFFDHSLAKGRSWYRAHFPLHAGIGARTWVTGEASPYYLFHPQVPARAAGVVPNARLVVLLRHPVDRAYSHYQHMRMTGREALSFEEAIEREAERTGAGWARLMAGTSDNEVEAQTFSYLARGRYAEQLERWLAHFPIEQLLVLKAEDLFARPEQAVGAVLRHLGVGGYDGLVLRQLNARSYPPMSDALRARLSDYYREPIESLRSLTGRDFGWEI